ncbi:MAG: type I-B CRISPR-associated protein Cas5b [Candidatus Eremiobacterota bacterium]
MRILVFDIWGDYGHFKKFHTTSSPLSFSIPPPTAVYGIIGAIAGISKENYTDTLNQYNLKIAVGINKPVKKMRMGVNWIELKKSFEKLERAPQIKQEFLKDCSFRIYISGDNEFLENFKKLLLSHRSVYTPCLGISQCLANFQFTGDFNGELKEADEKGISIHSAILNNYPLKIEEGKSYHKERMPVLMKPDRQVIDYREIIFETKGNTICITGGSYINISGSNPVVFIN